MMLSPYVLILTLAAIFELLRNFTTVLFGTPFIWLIATETKAYCRNGVASVQTIVEQPVWHLLYVEVCRLEPAGITHKQEYY